MVQIDFTTFVSGAASTIDVGQSFWVQVSSPGADYIYKSIVTAGSNSFIREFDPQEEAYFGITSCARGWAFGKTFIQFHEESTPEWDWEMDATHRHSGNSANPEVYTYFENGHKSQHQ